MSSGTSHPLIMDSTPNTSSSTPSSSSSSTIVPSSTPHRAVTPPAPPSTPNNHHSSSATATSQRSHAKPKPMQMKMQIQRFPNFDPRFNASQSRFQSQHHDRRRQHQHQRPSGLPRNPQQQPHNQASLPIHFIPFSFEKPNRKPDGSGYNDTVGSTMLDLGGALDEQMLYYALPDNAKESNVRSKSRRVAYKVFTYACSDPGVGSGTMPSHGHRPVPIPGQFDPLLRPFEEPVIKAWPLNRYEDLEEEGVEVGHQVGYTTITGDNVKGKGKQRENESPKKHEWISTLLSVDELVPVYVPVHGLRCWECRGGWWGEGGGVH